MGLHYYRGFQNLVFESIVYNRTIIYKRQNFLKVVPHKLINDQWNQTTCLYEIQVTVFHSRAIFVTVTSEWLSKEGYL